MAIKSCQNLRRYQKKQNLLPKPEKVPKRPKNKSSRSLGAWRPPELCFFWYLLRFWQGFQEKYCQNLRRYQKNQSLEVKILPKPEEVPKKPKKKQSSRGVRLGGLKNFVFFGTSSGFGKVFKENTARTWGGTKKTKKQSLEVKILPKPEEVPKKPKTTKFKRSPGPKTSENLLFFFCTSSGFGKIFTSRLWFFWYLLRFWHIFLENLAKI